MSKSITAKNARQNDIMTQEDKEYELEKSQALLKKVKSNPEESAKVKVELHDRYNTVFFLSPSRVGDVEYVNRLILRVNNRD